MNRDTGSTCPILSNTLRERLKGVKAQQNQTNDDHRLLVRAEVATRLNTTERHVRRLIENGRLPSVRLGGKVRIHPEDLDAFIESLRAIRSTTGIHTQPTAP